MAGASKKGGAERLSSPEQLNDVLRVTNPRIWMMLAAIIALLVGLLVWSTFASVESYVSGLATAKQGELNAVFDNNNASDRISPGMIMEVAGTETPIISVEKKPDGAVYAYSQAQIPDGAYEVRVGYKNTQIISLLFN